MTEYEIVDVCPKCGGARQVKVSGQILTDGDIERINKELCRCK